MVNPAQTFETCHATCVSIDDKSVLILGASGAGKSSLALQLMAYGATLVADDQTKLTVKDGVLWASCHRAISGMIEARGVGILHVPQGRQAPVTLAVDLDRSSTARLPEPRHYSILGFTVPCLWHAPSPHFAASVLHCLRYGIGHPP